jgi:hypothetical protein
MVWTGSCCPPAINETEFFSSKLGFFLSKTTYPNQKPWSLAFSFFKFESFASTFPAASPQRVTGKESYFLASFCSGTTCGTQAGGFFKVLKEKGQTPGFYLSATTRFLVRFKMQHAPDHYNSRVGGLNVTPNKPLTGYNFFAIL